MLPRFLTELKELRSEVTRLSEENEQLKSIQQEKVDTFKQFFNQTPKIAVQGYNNDREVIYWNKFSEELYGYTNGEALGKKLEELIIPEFMRQDVITSINNWVEDDVPIEADEHWLLHKDGSMLPVYSQHVLIRTGNDECEMFCMDIDLRELKNTEEMLTLARESYTIDSLTGLKSKFHYNQMIDEYLESVRKSEKVLVYCLLDLDNFKLYNDTYGHMKGDEVLKKVGKILLTCLTRPDDVIIRSGGEEFLVMYTVDKNHNYLGPVENIIRLTEELQIEHVKNSSYGVITISGGAAVINQDDNMPLEKISELADTALTAAKKAGKNNFVHYVNSMV
ncbi:MAG: GGDEF domain-containing protein [Spirochaetales bacterium]|nr:GGDEF domain-containing protein [Spirochaetales bacterium]